MVIVMARKTFAQTFYQEPVGLMLSSINFSRTSRIIRWIRENSSTIRTNPKKLPRALKAATRSTEFYARARCSVRLQI